MTGPGDREPLHVDQVAAQVADVIRARLARAIAEADQLDQQHAGRPPRGLFQATPDTVSPWTPTGLPAAASELLARVTGRPCRPILPPAMRDPAADARAAMHADRGPVAGRLAADTITAQTVPGPFTVPPALAGMVGEDRPRVIADAVRAHVLAEEARHRGALVDEDAPRAVAGRPVHAVQLADGRGFVLAAGEDGRPEWRPTGSRPLVGCPTLADAWQDTPGAPTNRRHDPAPTTNNRKLDTPGAVESSETGAVGGRLEPQPGPCTACRTSCPLIGGPCCPHEGCDPRRIDDQDAPPCPIHDAPHERPQDAPQDDTGPSTPGHAPTARTSPHTGPAAAWDAIRAQQRGRTRPPATRTAQEPAGRPRPLPGQPLPPAVGPLDTNRRPHVCTRPDTCQDTPQEPPPVPATEHHAPGCPGPHPLGTLCHGPRAHERAPWPAQDRPAWLVDVREPIPPDPLPQDGPSAPGTWTPAPATVAALAAVGIDAPRVHADLARVRRSRTRSRAVMRALRARARAARAGRPLPRPTLEN